MFCWQKDFSKATQPMVNEAMLRQLLESEDLKRQADVCYFKFAAGDKKGYALEKKKLPMLIFSAESFKDNARSQSNVTLNGLCVLDVDHLQEPAQQVYDKYVKPKIDGESIEKGWKIVFVYITPSREGLKIVFTANPQVGNLADNQILFSQFLGLENDQSIKDASRGQFAMPMDYVLYADFETLINYKDATFEKKFGERYRKGDSSPIVCCTGSSAGAVSNSNAGDSGCSGCAHSEINLSDLKYGEQSVEAICAAYTAKYGSPVKGDRHRYLIKVAGHIRYIVDNNPQKLEVALRSIPWVREWESTDADAGEINNIAKDVCGYRMWREIPQALERVLSSIDRSSDEGGQEEQVSATKRAIIANNQEIWGRLQPLLVDDPLNTICCSNLPTENKIAGIFVSAAMFDTLATRVNYRHFDGKLHRMNPNVACIGNPASGKSFADEYDDAIMAVMIAADEPGRRAEAEYKKEQKKRHTSNKAAKGEQPLKEPEECIRYIPSRTSNAIFYRRQKNAKELVNGEVMPLHLYTFDSELDSSVVAQSGGTWIGKHDLELKAFHNEKSGVDFANSDSVNELLPVYWNQIVTGTEVALSKKINLRNVNDGLCSRIAFVRINGDEFSMIAKGVGSSLEKKQEDLKKWGEFFDSLKGELIIPKLVNHCYTLCERAAMSAKKEKDHVKDYLRKRAVFYAEWFTIPRIVARAEMERKKNPKINIMKPTIKKSDLDFAELIFDVVMYYQDFYFGRMLEDAWTNAHNSFVQRPQTRTSPNEVAFDELPTEFKLDDVVKLLSVNVPTARTIICRWKQRNKIKVIGKSVWKKI